MRVIIATSNKSKFKEIQHILQGIPFPLTSLARLKKKCVIRENGKTFQENALKKAMPLSKLYPRDLVIGEDSGLEVECLNGRPGIYSKRYSGKNATTLKNNRKLLRELRGVAKRKRKAQFRCVLAVAKNAELLHICEGRLTGYISEEMHGDQGFGYDPVFYLPQYRKTVAQIPLAEKNKISHRARAFRKLQKYLTRRQFT